MRVLVTGGGGFIGSHVVDKLMAKGITPRIFDLSASPYHSPLEVETFTGSITDPGNLDLAMRDCDAVIHLAAVADVGPADMDVNPASADLGWRNGVWIANGNLAMRHLGIPSVTVPMGLMDDIGMPVGLTFCGRAYSDTALLQLAAAFEATAQRRAAPPRTPRLTSD